MTTSPGFFRWHVVLSIIVLLSSSVIVMAHLALSESQEVAVWLMLVFMLPSMLAFIGSLLMVSRQKKDWIKTAGLVTIPITSGAWIFVFLVYVIDVFDLCNGGCFH